MNQACVSLEEVFAAAGARAASLVPETSGYLALAVADATSRLPYQHDDRAVLLTVDGSVMVPRKGAVAPPPEAARGLRDLLERLLATSTGSMPGLVSAARPRTKEQDVERVVTDIEGALIPVNRAAAKRALARLARETLRAKELGKLRKKPSQAPAAPGAAAPQATTSPARPHPRTPPQAAALLPAPPLTHTHAPRPETAAATHKRSDTAPGAPSAAAIHEAPAASHEALATSRQAPPHSNQPAQHSREPAQHGNEPAQHSNEPAQHSGQAALPTGEPSQHSRQPSQHSRQPSQHPGERFQPSNEPAQHSNELAQHSNEPAQHTGEAARWSGEARAATREAPAATREAFSATREAPAARWAAGSDTREVAPVTEHVAAAAWGAAANVAAPSSGRMFDFSSIGAEFSGAEIAPSRREIPPPALVVAPPVLLGTPVLVAPPARFEVPAPPPASVEIPPPALVVAPASTSSSVTMGSAPPPAPAVALAPMLEAALFVPTPTPFEVDVAFEPAEEAAATSDEADEGAVSAEGWRARLPLPASPGHARCDDAFSSVHAPESEPANDLAPANDDGEDEPDATIADPLAMAVIEATYREAHATPEPVVEVQERAADTGEDALTRPWRPVIAREELVHTPTASVLSTVLLSELGGSRADELLDAFHPEDHGDVALAAAATSLRAFTEVDPSPFAAARVPARATPTFLRRPAPASRNAASRDDADDVELDRMDGSPLPPPRVAEAARTRWPLALFAVGVLVLFAAWLYRPTLARDFFGLRKLMSPEATPQQGAPAHDAAPDGAPPAAETPPGPALPTRARDTRASGVGDGQHRRRD